MDNYRFISEFIASHFPGSTLEIVTEPKLQYRIKYQEKILLVIDNICASYFFPNRYRSDSLSWSSFLEGSLETISEFILRDLADAEFIVFDRRGKEIRKRPIQLTKTTCCPKCGALGTIKRYFFGIVGSDKFSMRLAKDRVLFGRSRKKDDPEALCVSCNWTGSTEIFRFPHKGV